MAEWGAWAAATYGLTLLELRAAEQARELLEPWTQRARRGRRDRAGDPLSQPAGVGGRQLGEATVAAERRRAGAAAARAGQRAPGRGVAVRRARVLRRRTRADRPGLPRACRGRRGAGAGGRGALPLAGERGLRHRCWRAARGSRRASSPAPQRRLGAAHGGRRGVRLRRRRMGGARGPVAAPARAGKPGGRPTRHLARAARSSSGSPTAWATTRSRRCSASERFPSRGAAGAAARTRSTNSRSARLTATGRRTPIR